LGVFGVIYSDGYLVILHLFIDVKFR